MSNPAELFQVHAETIAAIQSDPAALAGLMEYMTDAERREFDLLLSTLLWIPNTGPQTEAYFSPADELFYGGKPAGGKSDLLVGLALTAHRNSIIFRRELKYTSKIIQRSKEIIGANGNYNGSAHIWRNLPGNRTLEFGGVKDAGDEEAYKGFDHDLKAFDELPDFLYQQYKFLTAWTRTTIPGQRTRIVTTGNPPNTPEGAWVIDYYAAWLKPQSVTKPAMPLELRYYAMIDDEEIEFEEPTPFEHRNKKSGRLETIRPKSRTFIPASLYDNPFLRGTDYESTLQSLPEPLRSRLLSGDFSIGYEDDPNQVIPTDWIKKAQLRFKERRRPDTYLSALGIDPARGGQAKTCYARRYGNWFAPVEKYKGIETPDGPAVAKIAFELLTDEPGEAGEILVLIDIIGIGSSVYDSIRYGAADYNKPPRYSGRGLPPKRKTLKVIGVNVAEASNGVDRSGRMGFKNMKAEILWKFRESLDPDYGDDVCLPDDPEVMADLSSYRWFLTLRGIQIEDKEKQMERIGRSPDVGESILMASYLGNIPKQERPGSALDRALRSRGYGPRGFTRRGYGRRY
jgi:hypothetical protein